MLSLKAVGAGLYDTTHDFKYRGERPQNEEVTMAFGRLDDVFVAGGGRRWLVLACAGLYDTTHDFNFIWSSDLKTEMSVLMSKMLG